MIKFTFKRSIFSALAVAALTGAANIASAQIMFNNGAQIWTGPQAVVQVNGGLTNDGATGVIDHNGTMTIASNPATSPGTFTMSNASNTQGNGLYRVEQDWVNNATFTANNSNVELFGNLQQMITGSNITTFDTLILTGAGVGNDRKKSQTIDANIDATGALIINDRELDTDVNTMFVMNPDVNAVTNNTATIGSEGFVSSLAPGTLSRVTNTTGSYLFPTGSSLGTLRYRPVVLTPVTAAGSTYTARLANNNPDNDGFLRTVNDNTFCIANPNFYHAILRPAGADAADVEVAYLASADGNWDGMSHWRTTNNMWNDISAANAGVLGNYVTRERTNWLFANPGDPYVLTEVKPVAPTVSCVGPLCAGSDAQIVVNGVATSYTWTVPGGVTIINGQGTDTLSFNAGSTGGVISVVATSASGFCSSLPDSCVIAIAPSPIAGFDTIAGGPFNNSWAFVDSSNNGSTWFWDFGDGSTSQSQNPMHNYEGSGTYTVTQIVTSPAGCTDTILSLVTVNEGILIPNVFSPDGDGTNDQFYIPNSGLEQFSIEIFNRWGVKVFETTADEIRWDGISTSGVKMSDGTYYYILKAVSTSGKDYSTTGFLTLLGNN